jgi:hypothetical protein
MNMEDLYEDVDYTEYTGSDGSVISAIDSASSYETEMHGGICSRASLTSYEMLSDREKAVYEITLLSKKYAAMYTGDSEADSDTANEYADYMAEYKAFCEADGLSWNEIVYNVSAELQTETRDYLKNDNIISNMSYTSLDSNRIISNRAHGMLVACTDDTYSDMLIPALSGDISYEDTMDTSSNMADYGNAVMNSSVASNGIEFVAKIAGRFWEKVKSFASSVSYPVKAVKDIVCEYARNLAAFEENYDDIYEQEAAVRAEGTQEAAELLKDSYNSVTEDASDTLKGMYDTASEYVNNNTVSDMADDVKSYAADKYEQAVDFLGNVSDGSEDDMQQEY